MERFRSLSRVMVWAWAFFAMQFLWGVPYGEAGEAGPGWQAEWEKTVSAAKAERQLTIYANPGYDAVFAEFEKKYLEIKVVYVTGRGSPDLLPRLLSEQRAGKYIGDLFLAGPTPAFRLHEAEALVPMTLALILPDVVDESKWWEGRHPFVEKERKYIFSFNGVFRTEVVYNTKLVNPKELKSYWDLLNPKWKGKMVAYSPILAPYKFFYHHPDLGPEFLRRLFSEMEVTLSGDMRQIANWLAVGRFALAVLTSPSEQQITTAREQGLPIGLFKPEHFKEGMNLVTGAGSAGLLKRAPHPNAAKVALNWLLSREGQIAFQKHFPHVAESRRIDIPKDEVPPEFRRRSGIKYLDVDAPEFIDPKPIRDLMNRFLKAEHK